MLPSSTPPPFPPVASPVHCSAGFQQHACAIVSYPSSYNNEMIYSSSTSCALKKQNMAENNALQMHCARGLVLRARLATVWQPVGCSAPQRVRCKSADGNRVLEAASRAERKDRWGGQPGCGERAERAAARRAAGPTGLSEEQGARAHREVRAGDRRGAEGAVQQACKGAQRTCLAHKQLVPQIQSLVLAA